MKRHAIIAPYIDTMEAMVPLSPVATMPHTSLAVHFVQSLCQATCIIIYKVMYNDAPVYLCELVCPTRTLRSVNNDMLEVKRTKAGATASLCNNLPTVIKNGDNLANFQRLLKTHFFRIAYLYNSTLTSFTKLFFTIINTYTLIYYNYCYVIIIIINTLNIH